MFNALKHNLLKIILRNILIVHTRSILASLFKFHEVSSVISLNKIILIVHAWCIPAAFFNFFCAIITFIY